MKLDPQKWYFKTYAYVIAFLCVGPFALPLALVNPRYDIKKKVLATLLTLIATYFMVVVLARSMTAIYNYYNMLSQLMK